MTAAPRDNLTRSVEDYLKAVYHLSAAGAPASTTALAEQLGVAPASVSGMIKRLSEQGWLEHTPYRGAELTPEGRRVALRMLRRHRLVEAYLVGFLGYTWDTVHDEAERLEHAVSDLLVERMALALGDPAVDPHGDPIPAVDGTIAEFLHVPLSDLDVGEAVTIRRVSTSDDQRLRYLAGAGLVPGARVEVTARQPFNGPVTVAVDGEDRVVGYELAGIILCARGEP
jgi:DtxR family transcriptional regulator, Mn-dependent transcriptional regulator